MPKLIRAVYQNPIHKEIYRELFEGKGSYTLFIYHGLEEAMRAFRALELRMSRPTDLVITELFLSGDGDSIGALELITLAKEANHETKFILGGDYVGSKIVGNNNQLEKLGKDYRYWTLTSSSECLMQLVNSLLEK